MAGAGELIVTPAQLSAYFFKRGGPALGGVDVSEALRYVRRRSPTGPACFRGSTGWHRRSLQSGTNFESNLSEVRSRLEGAARQRRISRAGPGGIYDLDYLAGFLQVRHQLWLPGPLQARLQLLRDHDRLSEDEHLRLSESASVSADGGTCNPSGERACARKWLPVAGASSLSCRV